ncbi:MAG: hypothetical protein KatS3mg131_2021 [Candidatus Tectimicrobiota bacterium]|nr:MAG: hypothetical protein KatS3mg131_2021 [Candidatus Tectomicrobia bacterium]
MERLLLMLEPGENRRLLEALLAPRYEVLLGTDAAALQQAFDLLLLDGVSLKRLRAEVEARRAAEAPLLLPVLLLTTRQEVGLATAHLWQTVDEVVLLPVEKIELLAGLEVCLRARRLSREQEQLRLALADSEARYRQLVENPLVGAWEADLEGRYVFVSRRLAEMAGYTPEEVLGMSMLDRIAPEQRPWLAARLQQRRAGQLPPDVVEAELVRKDGSRFTALVAPATLYDSQGRVKGFIGLKLDISERKQLEQELARRVQELEALNRQLAAANADLETYARSIAHDLRAPLRAIQAFAAVLRDEYGAVLDATGQDYAQRIVAAAERLDTLIADLLAWSRLGTAALVPEPVALAEVVDEAQRLLAAEIAARQAEIAVALPLPRVRAHRATLLQVVLNLLSNAIKFVAPGVRPQVRLWAEARQGRVRLWVADNGIGIAPEAQERIFGVFERLHGIEAYPGTGMGLAIVRRAMERLGGAVGVESAPGEGSRFWIELPQAEEPEA